MYKYIGIFTIMTLCLFDQTFSYLEDVSFETYLENIQAASKYGSHLSPVQIELSYNTVADKACTRQEDEDNFYMDPICFLQKTYPTMEFMQVIDTLYDNIQGFNHVYNSAPAESFNYEGGSPIYKNNISRDFLLLQNTQAHKAIATFHTIEEDRIQVPKTIIAEIIAQGYTFYVAYNDTSMRKGCALKNYEIALHSMDKVFLYPGDVFNFNTHIKNRDYCTGRGRTDLQFYGGVCGAASQLFRTSLLIPGVAVTQRHGHSERWARYYGDDITGDDAAIYEMHKQFEIQNNDTRGLYFRTIKGEEHDYLIAISPYKSKQGVQITRQRETALKTNITKNIYDIHTQYNTQESIQFPSSYRRKNYTSN